MQFKSIALILGCAIATGIMASPLTVRDNTDSPSNGYTELYREEASDSGSLVYYGLASGSKMVRSAGPMLKEREGCGSGGVPTCDTSNEGRNEICELLVASLQSNQDIPVGESPRQICYEGGAAAKDKFCCVSWHDVVPGLFKRDLIPYAAESK